jgi:hypothetical protein
LDDAERLIAAWNERQEKRMPMLFSPTIGAAISAHYFTFHGQSRAFSGAQALKHFFQHVQSKNPLSRTREKRVALCCTVTRFPPITVTDVSRRERLTLS